MEIASDGSALGGRNPNCYMSDSAVIPPRFDAIRFELPVSRTTLNTCGGLPMEISEKSREFISEMLAGRAVVGLTLGVEEILEHKRFSTERTLRIGRLHIPRQEPGSGRRLHRWVACGTSRCDDAAGGCPCTSAPRHGHGYRCRSSTLRKSVSEALFGGTGRSRK